LQKHSENFANSRSHSVPRGRPPPI
jgi:hypothetical protein